MEYSEDVVIKVGYSNNIDKGQVKTKKYKWIATISAFCVILIILDGVLIYNFINLLQNVM